MFLRSNLHDTFLHSIYRQPFVEQFGDTIRSVPPMFISQDSMLLRLTTAGRPHLARSLCI